MNKGDPPPALPGHQPTPAEPPSGNAADVLKQDIACPNCQYNLRGLGTGEVVCPECGTQSNVARLLTRRWNKPWYQAPKYNQLALPAGGLLISAIVLMFAVVANEIPPGGFVPTAMLLMGWTVLTLLGWALLMTWVCRSMEGLRTAGYALVIHLALAGYLIGVPMFITGLGWLVSDLIDSVQLSNSTSSFIWSVLLIVGGIGLFVLGRVIERFVAAYCIRLYLRRTPA